MRITTSLPLLVCLCYCALHVHAIGSVHSDDIGLDEEDVLAFMRYGETKDIDVEQPVIVYRKPLSSLAASSSVTPSELLQNAKRRSLQRREAEKRLSSGSSSISRRMPSKKGTNRASMDSIDRYGAPYVPADSALSSSPLSERTNGSSLRLTSSRGTQEEDEDMTFESMLPYRRSSTASSLPEQTAALRPGHASGRTKVAFPKIKETKAKKAHDLSDEENETPEEEDSKVEMVDGMRIKKARNGHEIRPLGVRRNTFGKEEKQTDKNAAHRVQNSSGTTTASSQASGSTTKSSVSARARPTPLQLSGSSTAYLDASPSTYPSSSLAPRTVKARRSQPNLSAGQRPPQPAQRPFVPRGESVNVSPGDYLAGQRAYFAGQSMPSPLSLLQQQQALAAAQQQRKVGGMHRMIMTPWGAFPDYTAGMLSNGYSAPHGRYLHSSSSSYVPSEAPSAESEQGGERLGGRRGRLSGTQSAVGHGQYETNTARSRTAMPSPPVTPSSAAKHAQFEDHLRRTNAQYAAQNSLSAQFYPATPHSVAFGADGAAQLPMSYMTPMMMAMSMQPPQTAQSMMMMTPPSPVSPRSSSSGSPARMVSQSPARLAPAPPVRVPKSSPSRVSSLSPPQVAPPAPSRVSPGARHAIKKVDHRASPTRPLSSIAEDHAMRRGSHEVQVPKTMSDIGIRRAKSSDALKQQARPLIAPESLKVAPTKTETLTLKKKPSFLQKAMAVGARATSSSASDRSSASPRPLREMDGTWGSKGQDSLESARTTPTASLLKEKKGLLSKLKRSFT